MTSSRWCFTLHYADVLAGQRISAELANQFGAGVFKYLCWGYEVCPSTGRKVCQRQRQEVAGNTDRHF